MNEIAATILKNNSYCTIATVCDDGAPWSVPVHFAYDSTHIYWFSHEETVHSKNIARDGRVFIVIFDSRQTAESLGDRGAVYVSSKATKLSADAAMAARDIYSDRYPDDNSRKVAEWGVYSAPIGTIMEDKTKGQLLYFQASQEPAE